MGDCRESKQLLVVRFAVFWYYDFGISTTLECVGKPIKNVKGGGGEREERREREEWEIRNGYRTTQYFCREGIKRLLIDEQIELKANRTVCEAAKFFLV
jgi:hypothetical protein